MKTSQDIAIIFHAQLKGFILKRVSNTQDAEDILQDAFYKIHNNIDGLRNRTKLESWLYQIVRNAIIDFYRRQKTDSNFEEEIHDIANEPDGNETQTLASCLQPMIDSLPQKYRQAVLLTDIEGATQVAMAKELGLSVSGAKSRVQRARQKLKEALLECCQIEIDQQGYVLDFQSNKGSCRDCD